MLAMMLISTFRLISASSLPLILRLVQHCRLVLYMYITLKCQLTCCVPLESIQIKHENERCMQDLRNGIKVHIAGEYYGSTIKKKTFAN